MTEQLSSKSKWRVCCVIPVHNNAATIRSVAVRCLQEPGIELLVVVDDGSTDAAVSGLLAGLERLLVLRHETNLGKGQAIQTALRHLAKLGFDYMITLDGDGQHYPEDIGKFLQAIEENDHSLAIGVRDMEGPEIPQRSRFGRNFANFWIKLETGCDVGDAQSGFRAYPVKYISQMKFLCSRYNFEAESLARLLWAGISVKDVPISVWYPENPGERVSSFRPWLDNWRFTMINFHLICMRLLPLPKKQLIPKEKLSTGEILQQCRNPLKLLRLLLHENATPSGLAAAAAVGSLLAILPIIGLHSVLILYVAVRLHLNKIMAFNIQHIFMPPLIPFICLEAGYFIRHGRFLTELSMQTVLHELPQRFLEWWLGALLLAPFIAGIIWAAVYWIALIIQRRNSGVPDNEK
ncbi:MAG: hypothetical protein A2X49_16555 [Lentisphaerae bacterium GWF2_52_8]|nr:MAG: hypothetical protein A2X49_16555 [Lentisphaerae bacterium GWF2_52_8]